MQRQEYIQQLIKHNHQSQAIACYQVLEHKSFKQGQVVFLYGSYPDSFYMLLKGTVLILTPKDQGTLNHELQLNAVKAQAIVQYLDELDGCGEDRVSSKNDLSMKKSQYQPPIQIMNTRSLKSSELLCLPEHAESF